MTPNEAIRRIKEHNEIHSKKERGFAILITKALDMAVEALEKQIPKKPDYEDYDAKCPVCGHEFENNVNDWGCSFCQGCGQKLDWSDEE